MTGMGPHENIRQPFIWGEANTYNAEGKSGGISSWDEANGSLDGVDEQLLNPDSLLNVYVEMIQLKGSTDALKYGDLNEIDNSNNKLMTYTRTYNGQTLLVIHNMTSAERSASTNINLYSVVYKSDDFVEDQSNFTFMPYSTTILDVSESTIIFE